MELIGQINANLILMVNESVPEEDDKNNRIKFKSIKRFRFDQTQDLAEKLVTEIFKQLDFEVELLDQGSGSKSSLHNLYKTDPFSTFSALPFDNVL